MTPTELAQFYTPLIGLIGLAFWVGGLSNRVKTLEREAKERKDEGKDDDADHDRIVRMETILERMELKMGTVERDMSGVQRALAKMTSQNLHFTPGELPG
jgi:hypothetical protein